MLMHTQLPSSNMLHATSRGAASVTAGQHDMPCCSASYSQPLRGTSQLRPCQTTVPFAGGAHINTQLHTQSFKSPDTRTACIPPNATCLSIHAFSMLGSQLHRCHTAQPVLACSAAQPQCCCLALEASPTTAWLRDHTGLLQLMRCPPGAPAHKQPYCLARCLALQGIQH